MYGGYIILWWVLGGLIFYCLLNLITQSPKEEADFLYPYSSYMLSGILISWMHSRTYYVVGKDILQIRTPYVLLKTLVLHDIVQAVHYDSTRFNAPWVVQRMPDPPERKEGLSVCERWGKTHRASTFTS